MRFRENDLRLNDDSGKWHSAKKRFERKTFVKMTFRENDFRLNDVSRNWRSAEYLFEKMIFDIIYFRQLHYSGIWWFDQLTFDVITFRENNESGKWCGPIFTSWHLSYLWIYAFSHLYIRVVWLYYKRNICHHKNGRSAFRQLHTRAPVMTRIYLSKNIFCDTPLRVPSMKIKSLLLSFSFGFSSVSLV